MRSGYTTTLKQMQLMTEKGRFDVTIATFRQFYGAGQAVASIMRR